MDYLYSVFRFNVDVVSKTEESLFEMLLIEESLHLEKFASQFLMWNWVKTDK